MYGSNLAPTAVIPVGGRVEWLDVTADGGHSWPVRLRTMPLGLSIAPADMSRGAFYVRGARLRGSRCFFAAVTVSGAALTRAPLPRTAASEMTLHVLVRGESHGSVFDRVGELGHAVIKVLDLHQEVNELFRTNSHVYTLNVPTPIVGMELPSILAMMGRTYQLNGFQSRLLASAAHLLAGGADGPTNASTMVGIDRYLGSLAGLLLRTAVATPTSNPDESVRAKAEALIYERGTDASLTPASVAAALNISLRQLYRECGDSDSPAALIRRRRLERAAELLSAGRPIGTMESIANECGFASAEYFSRAFRKEFGMSPRAYRSTHRDVPSAR